MRGALCDDTKYSCVPKVKLGRILKLNLNSVINPLKPYYTENEDSFGFKLWPRFAPFFFAFVPTRFGFFFLFSFPLRKRKLMCPSSKMQNEDIFISNLVPRALFPGFGGVSLSQRFVHPHSQIPSVLGIPRYPPGMPKSLVFWWWWWWGVGLRELPDIFKKVALFQWGTQKCHKITNTASLPQGRLSRIGAKKE